MSSLAVSAFLVVLASGTQTGRLTPHEQDMWQKMAPAVATLMDNDRPIAAAAMIDDSGLFVASKNSIQGKKIQARLSNGDLIWMSVVARNGATGLALLQAEGWEPSSDMKAFRAPSGEEERGNRLFAILGTGPIRAEFVASNRNGVLPKSRRVVPLTEFRFEAPAELIGSAIIVCENGEFIGALNATLRKKDSGTQNLVQGLTDGSNGLNRIIPQIQQANQYGPGELTVAYTVGPDLVRQVVDGFRSSGHTVSLPSLGVMCTDTIGGGATIQKVQPGSAAEKADLRPGDVIHDIAGREIANQIDFSKTMLKQRIGSKIVIRVSRGGMVLIRDIIVGKEKDETSD